MRFQDILRNTYHVDPGSTPGPARNPGGNLFAKVSLWPALNQRHRAVAQLRAREPGIPGRPDALQALRALVQRASGPGTVNATRLAWTMARGGGLSNELDLAHLRVRRRSTACLGPYSEVEVRADESFLGGGDGCSCAERFANQTVWELTDNASWSRAPTT